jgi:hypothetical protein
MNNNGWPGDLSASGNNPTVTVKKADGTITQEDGIIFERRTANYMSDYYRRRNHASSKKARQVTE